MLHEWKLRQLRWFYACVQINFHVQKNQIQCAFYRGIVITFFMYFGVGDIPTVTVITNERVWLSRAQNILYSIPQANTFSLIHAWTPWAHSFAGLRWINMITTQRKSRNRRIIFANYFDILNRRLNFSFRKMMCHW